MLVKDPEQKKRKTQNTMKLNFPSKPENLVLVEKLVDEICEKFYINEDFYGNILISITEAVNNAMLHGNSEDESKIVDVDMEITNNIIKFYIKDSGEGFDYNNLPDPTAPENIEKTTGRGVFLMKNLSDLVIFSDNGSTVEIQFRV